MTSVNKALLILGFSALIAVVGIIAVPQDTRAAAGPAGPADGGSFNGGYFNTRAGWGWRQYDLLAGERPVYSMSGNADNVVNECSGFRYIIGFSIGLNQTSVNRPGGHQPVQPRQWSLISPVDYQNNQGTGPANISNYNNGPGLWVPWNLAEQRYNNLPLNERGGTQWLGSNADTAASWYCFEPLAPPPPPINWRVLGDTNVNRVTATVGDVITWSHRVVNEGPTNTNVSVTSDTYLTGFTAAGWGDGTRNTESGAMNAGQDRRPGDFTSYQVQPSDVGRTLCQRVRWSPSGSGNPNTGQGPNRCVTIVYNYDLRPAINVDESEVSAGTEVTVRPSVAKTGPTNSRVTDWVFSLVRVNPGSDSNAIPTGTQSNQDPCAFYGGDGRVCQNDPQLAFLTGGGARGQQVFDVSTHYFNVRTDTIEEFPVGTEICYGLSVKNAGANDTRWSHSTVDCVVISKRPFVQILGSDLIVGRGKPITNGSNVSTNVKRIFNKQYGSWAEYGILPSGKVSGMASASGYAGGITPSVMCNVSYLTLSNTPGVGSCTDETLGGYSISTPAPAVGSRFPLDGAEQITTRTIDSLEGGRTYTAANNATIRLTGPSEDIQAGKWVVINAPNSDVRIETNINYTEDPLTSVADIPQMVIIARNISVADNVENIDSWLVASGTINTCDAANTSSATGLNANICSRQLRVNGPIITDRILLHRTGGAGNTEADTGDPAEKFNLRPDAYLWATSQQSSESKVRTVMTTELPPRF